MARLGRLSLEQTAAENPWLMSFAAAVSYFRQNYLETRMVFGAEGLPNFTSATTTFAWISLVSIMARPSSQ